MSEFSHLETNCESDDWRSAYTDPVIRATTVHSTKFHRPDPDASDPVPACTVPSETKKGYVVKERQFAERARDPCQREACFGNECDQNPAE